jgi:putative ABC transport system permease protein
MDISESIGMALKTLSANRLRSLLTVLGIIIGNASVIAMIGVGQGAQRYTTEQLQALGTNLLFIFPSTGDARRGSQGGGNTLMLSDAEAIARQIPSVRDVAPQISGQQLITYLGNATRTSVIGTTASYSVVRNTPVKDGRFLTPADVDTQGLVVALGSQLAQNLFGDRSPLGERIQINNISFEVVGVMAEKGASSGGNQDEAAYIPISTMATLIAGRTSPQGISVNSISVSALDEASVDIALYQITNLLRVRHQITGADDFTVRNQQETLDAANNVTGALTILLASTAGISLLVGGIGIMNIMLASVTERTSEIGLRKAIGASQTDVLQQFLIEAVILALTGGVIGTVLGVGAVVIVGIYTPLQATVSVEAIALAVGVSGGIGLFFGVFPARRAARLDPIEALRSL